MFFRVFLGFVLVVVVVVGPGQLGQDEPASGDVGATALAPLLYIGQMSYRRTAEHAPASQQSTANRTRATLAYFSSRFA